MASLSSRLILSLEDRASGPARRIAGNLSAVSRQANKYRAQQRAAFAPVGGGVKAMVGLAAGYVGVREGIRSTVGAAMSFEDAMSDLKKVVSFDSPKQFQAIRRDVLNMSTELPIAAEGIAAIFAAGGQANIPTEKLGQFARMTAKVSTAWEMSAGETGAALAEIRTALGLTVSQTGLVADAINHLGNRTSASADKLLNFTKRTASAAKTAGMAAKDATAFGAAMIGSGFGPEEAATSFRNMVKYLSQGEGASKSRKAAMRALGFEPVALQKAMRENTVDAALKAMEALKTKIPEHRRTEVADALFGAEARALAPLIENPAEVRRGLGLVEDETKFAGSAAREYEVASKRTSNSLKLLKNNLRAVGITAGDALLPSIAAGADALAKSLRGMDSSLSVFGRMKTYISEFATGLGFGDASEQIETFKGVWRSFRDWAFGPDMSYLPKHLRHTVADLHGGAITEAATQVREFGAALRSIWDGFNGAGLGEAAKGLGALKDSLAEMGGVGLLAVGTGLAAVAWGITRVAKSPIMRLTAIAWGISSLAKAAKDAKSLGEFVSNLADLEAIDWAGIVAGIGAVGAIIKTVRGGTGLLGGGPKPNAGGGGESARSGAGTAANTRGDSKSTGRKARARPGAPAGDKVGPTKPTRADAPGRSGRRIGGGLLGGALNVFGFLGKFDEIDTKGAAQTIADARRRRQGWNRWLEENVGTPRSWLDLDKPTKPASTASVGRNVGGPWAAGGERDRGPTAPPSAQIALSVQAIMQAARKAAIEASRTAGTNGMDIGAGRAPVGHRGERPAPDDARGRYAQTVRAIRDDAGALAAELTDTRDMIRRARTDARAAQAQATSALAASHRFMAEMRAQGRGSAGGYQERGNIVVDSSGPLIAAQNLATRMKSALDVTAEPKVATAAMDAAAARSRTAGQTMRDSLNLHARVSVNAVEIDSALAKALRLKAAMQGLGGTARGTAPGVTGARARGGPVRAGGAYLVGERGPELVTPKRSGFIHTARRTAAMGRAGGKAGAGYDVPQGAAVASRGAGRAARVGPINMTMTVNASEGTDGKELARQVMAELNDAISSEMQGLQADTEWALA